MSVEREYCQPSETAVRSSQDYCHDDYARARVVSSHGPARTSRQAKATFQAPTSKHGGGADGTDLEENLDDTGGGACSERSRAGGAGPADAQCASREVTGAQVTEVL